MTRLSGGFVTLKDEGTGRLWTVQLESFLIGKYAVTQELFQLIARDREAPLPDATKPVVDVSCIEATRFCNLLSRELDLRECYSTSEDGEVVCDWKCSGYRLPSEAEWEYACRAGSNEVRYGAFDSIAWYGGNSQQAVHEVGRKQANEWGLHDMIGNVWEWCWDVFDPIVYGPYRVFRGGGWADNDRSCRASCRRKSHPTFRMDDLGFRLARSIF